MNQVTYKTNFWSEVGQWINTLGFWIPLAVLGLVMLDYCLQQLGFKFEGFGLWKLVCRGWRRLRG